MKRKKNQVSFIDGKKYFSNSGPYKIGNDIVYKRMSDDKISLGHIKWFEMSKSEEKVLVTVTDNIEGSFQVCFIEDIQDSPNKKTLKKLREKWANSL